MERMFPIMRAILLELQFFLDIAPVLAGGIIPPFTLGTLQGYQFHCCLLTRHNQLLIFDSNP
jgi:hypothetical protein